MSTVATQSRPAKPVHRARKVRPIPPLPMPPVLLEATTTPEIVTIPGRTVIACEGSGAPEASVFQAACGALYGIAFTLKFMRKHGGRDFKIGPLEGVWWAAKATGELAPRETWRWELRIAVPDDVTTVEVREAIHAATTRRGGKLEGNVAANGVFLEHVAKERVGRALHVGSYMHEGRTLDAIGAALASHDLVPARCHVEIYLSDPRRTPPERRKTILLRPTTKS